MAWNMNMYRVSDHGLKPPGVCCCGCVALDRPPLHVPLSIWQIRTYQMRASMFRVTSFRVSLSRPIAKSGRWNRKWSLLSHNSSRDAIGGWNRDEPRLWWNPESIQAVENIISNTLKCQAFTKKQ